MQLLAGALMERPPGPKYTAELRFAELEPQTPLPKPPLSHLLEHLPIIRSVSTAGEVVRAFRGCDFTKRVAYLSYQSVHLAGTGST